MNRILLRLWTLYSLLLATSVHSDCPAQESGYAYPVERAYCASDAVFVGELVKEEHTVRDFDVGDGRTIHIRELRMTIRVLTLYKGELPSSVTFDAQPDFAHGGFMFRPDEPYLIFAHCRPDAGSCVVTANCESGTAPLRLAAKRIEVLETLRRGEKGVDCDSIPPFETPPLEISPPQLPPMD